MEWLSQKHPQKRLATHISISEQHTLDDPMAKYLLKAKSREEIKFDQNRNSASKQIINKTYPMDRRKLREERERSREAELLKKRKLRK